MSKVAHKILTLKATSSCFTKLVGKAKYQRQWRMNDQWSSLLWAYYQDVLSPLINQNSLDGKTLDAALRKDKTIKANLSNYVKGTNSTGIMCRNYKPRSILNGSLATRTQVNCYVAVPPFDAEPELSLGQCWYETLPPTRIRESNRNKRIRSSDDSLESEDVFIEPENQAPKPASQAPSMQIEYSFDPWDDKKIRQLFSPLPDEHPLDAIARRIDILMDVRKSPEGYKLIVEGGDTNETCTELDKIKLQDKSIYLIAVLRNALKGYPNITWAKCCEEASQVCSAFTTSYCERTIRDWWQEFKINDCFAHPRGPNGHFKKSKERLPPFLADNEDLLKKIVSHCTHILNDLSIDNAKEYVVEKLIPMGYPLTSDFTAIN